MLTQIMKKIRQDMRDSSDNLNIPDIYFEESRTDDGSHCLMPLVALKTRPCSWLENCGGCSMCGYQLAASLDRTPTEKNIVNQTKYTIKNVPPSIYPLITFNSAGSFLNPKEVSDKLRLKLLAMLKKAGYKEFNFECRPEFLLNEKRISELKKYFDVVSVGIGLESSSDFIRNECLNKGTRLESYLRASKILKKHSVDYDAYIQMGKPFLTTREDIDDAVKTALFAFRHGFGRIFLMLCNIQPATLTHFLWKKGRFKPPMLWSAIEVIKKLPPKYRSRVYVKGFNRAVPMPLEFPQNCERCNIQVMDKLMHWNLTGDFFHIKTMPECSCYKKFQNKLKENPKDSLENRYQKIKRFTEKELEIEST